MAVVSFCLVRHHQPAANLENGRDVSRSGHDRGEKERRLEEVYGWR